MGKIKTSAIGIIICFLIIGSCISLLMTKRGEAEGNSIYVNVKYPYQDGDGSADRPYRSIQYAIDIAEEGDNIYVFQGTYNETLQINKQISLIGLDRDNVTIDRKGESPRYTIEITADYVTLEDLTVSDTRNENRVALIYIESGYVTIEGTNITQSNTWGIYLDSSNDNTIGNNLINQTKGVYSYYSNNNVYSNNNFGNCTDAAIKLRNSDNNIIYNNSFDSNKYALYSLYCSNNNFSVNSIDNTSFHGIKLLGGNNNIIRNNLIDTCANGIDIDSPDSKIIGNKLNKNQIGINLAGSNCQIKNNDINNSAIWGIYTAPASKDNNIYLNYFFDNAVNAKESGNNQWYYEIQGNWWFDYSEVDKDLDGIGDVRYLIPGGGQDLFPTGKFLKSPLKPTDPSPEDEEDDVGLSVTLRVTVSDPDSDTVNVFFYGASDDKLYGVDYNAKSGEEASCGFSLPFETTFLWYAVVTDGKLENRSDIWIFTTRLIPPTNLKPVADSGGPYTAGIGEEITLDGSASNDSDGTIDFYRWNFGDGSSEILATSPKHTYSDPGTYTVTLTVVDNEGRSSSAETTATISTSATSNKNPVSDPGGPYSGKAKKSIAFNGSGSYDTDGTILSYSWDFNGDGTIDSHEQNATHTYSAAGTYTVTLKVIDDDGANDTSSTIVNVASASEETPGFELILVVFAILWVFLSKRKRS